MGDLINAISKHSSKGVWIDISAVSIIDSFMGRILGNTAVMSKIMDRWRQLKTIGANFSSAHLTNKLTRFTLYFLF